MSQVRALAAQVIDRVVEGQSLTACLDKALPFLKDSRDRALVQAITYGVCRFYTRLDVLLSFLLQKPLKAKDSDLHALLLVGLYQLMAMRIPAPVVVSETVQATETLKKGFARGLVNAVLRNYLRQQESLAQRLLAEEEAHYAHPAWWIKAIQHAWPSAWEAILTANNAQPPMALRVNARQRSRTDYLSQLQEQGESASFIPETAQGLLLEKPVLVDALPGFQSGEVSVQDGAAQLAAELLHLSEPNLRLLDACAAPGGKLMHCLELAPDLIATAVEKDPQRAEVIQENLTRLHLKAMCFSADVCDLDAWWDGQPFDRLLLDVPCSASGVIRRHPDIKLLREATDIPAFANEQARILNSLWPLLKTNGILLYVTCSIFPEENATLVKNFLVSHPDAQEWPLDVTWGEACPVGRQILPGSQQMDGFYYARIKKVRM